MAYSTGTAANTTALLAAIQAFAVAQGWVVDYAGVDGANQRLHIHLNGCFASFSTNYSTGTALFGLVGSSGFTSSAAAWNAQTAPVGNIKTCPLTVGGNAILPCTYHLFAQATPDTLAGVFVGTSGNIAYFMIGNMNKIGAYVGGDFYSAGDQISLAGAAMSPAASFIDIKTPTAFVQAYYWGALAGVDTGNNQAPLMPIRMFELVSGAYKPRGVLPWVRAVSRNYANADEINYGVDTWKVFYGATTASPHMVAFKK